MCSLALTIPCPQCPSPRLYHDFLSQLRFHPKCGFQRAHLQASWRDLSIAAPQRSLHVCSFVLVAGNISTFSIGAFYRNIYVCYVMFLDLNKKTVLVLLYKTRYIPSYHFLFSTCQFVKPPPRGTHCPFHFEGKAMTMSLHKSAFLAAGTCRGAVSGGPQTQG